MPGAAATGRFAPAPISTEAIRLDAAVAVTKLFLTRSCTVRFNGRHDAHNVEAPLIHPMIGISSESTR